MCVEEDKDIIAAEKDAGEGLVHRKIESVLFLLRSYLNSSAEGRADGQQDHHRQASPRSLGPHMASPSRQRATRWMDLQRAVMRPDAIPRTLQYRLVPWRRAGGVEIGCGVLERLEGVGGIAHCKGAMRRQMYFISTWDVCGFKQRITLWHGIMILVSSHSKIHNAHNNETATRDRLLCHTEYKSRATLTICYAVHNPLDYHPHKPLDYALAFLSFSCSCGVRLLNTSPNVGCCACS